METTPPKRASLKPKLRWFQFSLRTMMVAVTLSCIAGGWFGMKLRAARRQHAVVEQLNQRDFPYWYDYQSDETGQTNYNAPPRGPEWLRNLLGFDFFNHVTEVHIGGDHARTLDDQTFRAILALPDLQTLDIAETAIMDQRLSWLPEAHRLTWLSVEGQQVTDLGLGHICRCSELKRLGISSRTKVTPKGLMQIARLKNLEELWLSDQPVTDDVLRALRGENNLTSLALYGTPVTDAGMDVVGNFTRLTFLALDRTAVTDRGLSRLGGLTSLEILDLASTNVTDRGLVSLAKMRKLNFISLKSDRGVTDGGMKYLEALPAKCCIELEGTGITSAGYKRLSAALPEASISADESAGGQPPLPPGASIF
jgi:hypothetical protein